MNREYRLQISRSKYIEDSRAIAAIRLSNKDFLKGEVVMLNYYKNPDVRTDIGTLVAIGTKNGTGTDAYRILSAGDTIEIRKVVTDLADVSSLVHDEIYLYEDENEKWYYISLANDGVHRSIVEVSGGPYIFLDIETGFRWFYEDGICKREDDFLPSKDIRETMQFLLSTDIHITLESFSGYVFKTGEVKDVQFQVHALTAEGEDVTERCRFFIDGEELGLDRFFRFTLQNISTDLDLKVEARYYMAGGIYAPFYGFANIRFGYPFYYGAVNEDWEPTSENLKLLENATLNYKRTLIWDNIVLDYKKSVLAYPKKYGFLAHIYDDHGLDYIHDYIILDKDYIIDGTRYIVYIKESAVDIHNFKQQYVFEEYTSLIEEELTLQDLITAWKNRNISNGLVYLNEDGKIDPILFDNTELLPHYITELKGMPDYVPDNGMEWGEVYYIKTDKIIFTAISENQGKISHPEFGKLYYYDKEFYSWDGTEMRKFSHTNSSKITNLSEIL